VLAQEFAGLDHLLQASLKFIPMLFEAHAEHPSDVKTVKTLVHDAGYGPCQMPLRVSMKCPQPGNSKLALVAYPVTCCGPSAAHMLLSLCAARCRTRSSEVTEALAMVAARDAGRLLLAKAYKEGQLLTATNMCSTLQVAVDAQARSDAHVLQS
jgi:hypothetical protein